MNVLTSATLNYLDQAIVALKSAKEFCTFTNHFIFVADVDRENLVKVKKILDGYRLEWITLFGPGDLSETKTIYLDTFDYYNKFEISQLAKYVAIDYVLSNSTSDSNICVFIDADTYFYSDVCPIVERLGNNSVLLTPHLMGSSNEDNEHDIMLHGWINSGFSAFNGDNENTKTILSWLIDRIAKKAFLAPQLGVSGDQTWITALTILYSENVYICKDPGLNVAYWNLDQRVITFGENDAFMSNSSPLVMFHFSGFIRETSDKLSKHSKHRLIIGSPLEKICNAYRKEFDNLNKIIEMLAVIKAIDGCNKSLHNRIKKCEALHNVDMYKSMPVPGVFSRMGRILDSLVRRVESNIGGSR